jgi:hypothetical protein
MGFAPAIILTIFFCNVKIFPLLGDLSQKFNVYGSVHRKNILTYIQQDATLHTLFYLETAIHVSGGIPPIIRRANNCICSI